MRLPRGSTRGGRSSASGANGFSTNACRDLRSAPGPDAPGLFPPEVVVQVKALACELPASLGLPLSRMSIADVAREVRRAGIVARISDKTVWRWLHEDAIRPWQHRCWIFPRDPDFRVKAGESWISTKGTGTESPGATTSSSSQQTRRPVSRLASVPTGRCRPLPARPCAPNMSTCVGGHGPTWPPGMCVGPKSMGSANKRPASHHSAASCNK